MWENTTFWIHSSIHSSIRWSSASSCSTTSSLCWWSPSTTSGWPASSTRAQSCLWPVPATHAEPPLWCSWRPGHSPSAGFPGMMTMMKRMRKMMTTLLYTLGEIITLVLVYTSSPDSSSLLGTSWSCVCTLGSTATASPGRCSTSSAPCSSTSIPVLTLCSMCCCPRGTVTAGVLGCLTATGIGCSRRLSASLQRLCRHTGHEGSWLCFEMVESLISPPRTKYGVRIIGWCWYSLNMNTAHYIAVQYISSHSSVRFLMQSFCVGV